MVKLSRRDLDLERRWREQIEDQARSGLSIQAFCTQRGVSASSFHFWKRELKQRDVERAIDQDRSIQLGGSSGFMPVSIIATATTAIEIEVAGCVVRVRRGFDEEALARVVHVLGQIGGVHGEADRC